MPELPLPFDRHRHARLCPAPASCHCIASAEPSPLRQSRWKTFPRRSFAAYWSHNGLTAAAEQASFVPAATPIYEKPSNLRCSTWVTTTAAARRPGPRHRGSNRSSPGIIEHQKLGCTPSSQCSRGSAFVTVLRSDTPPPTEEARAMIKRVFRTFGEVVKAGSMVIEGTGFVAATFRSVDHFTRLATQLPVQDICKHRGWLGFRAESRRRHRRHGGRLLDRSRTTESRLPSRNAGGYPLAGRLERGLTDG